MVPLVVVGLGSATLTAVAANQTWATASASAGQVAIVRPREAPQVPLVLTLALVVLAAWGVLLVTRGVLRRLVAWLGALAATGALVAVVAGRFTLEDSLQREYVEQGATAVVEVGGWWWVAVVAAAVAAVVALLTALSIARWPEIGTRYDAPVASGSNAATTPAAGDPEPSNLELWKSLDEGRDPTA